MCMMRLMASKRTAFLAFECWTFFDFGGSCALFKIVSKHSVSRVLTAGSSVQEKKNMSQLTWVKVLNFQNPELRNSNLKTCSIPTKHSQFEV